MFPVIDRVAQIVDLRIQTTTITAEQALTRDTVAVGVDAIVFWQVDNAEAAAIHIADYREAIERVAQTSLREMIGATDLSRLLSDRRTADEQLRADDQREDHQLGRVARSVEIKDVSIPRELQDAMSRQAQAEREKDARVTLASAEREIAQQILQAAKLYGQRPECAEAAADEPAVRDEQGTRHDGADPDRHGEQPGRAGWPLAGTGQSSGGPAPLAASCRQERELRRVLIGLTLGDRSFDRLLDAPLIRRIGMGIAAIEEYPRHTMWLDQCGDHRHGTPQWTAAKLRPHSAAMSKAASTSSAAISGAPLAP